MIDSTTLSSEPARVVCVGDLMQATIFSGEEDPTIIGTCDRLEPDVVSGDCVKE